jgi:hypothetical protein
VRHPRHQLTLQRVGCAAFQLWCGFGLVHMHICTANGCLTPCCQPAVTRQDMAGLMVAAQQVHR